uniref:Uncharacterized protein n=1 Tax=Rhizophora mucronata TaxID=61149 RepID=A0A2P2QNN8_RHIMU
MPPLLGRKNLFWIGFQLLTLKIKQLKRILMFIRLPGKC